MKPHGQRRVKILMWMASMRCYVVWVEGTARTDDDDRLWDSLVQDRLKGKSSGGDWAHLRRRP